MAFPTSTISKVTPDALTNVPRMYVNFMGLFGPNGPMPLFLTEFARERILIHVNDFTRCRGSSTCSITGWSRSSYARGLVNQQTVSYEHEGEGPVRGIRWRRCSGDGSENFHNRDSVPDSAKAALRSGGWWGCRGMPRASRRWCRIFSRSRRGWRASWGSGSRLPVDSHGCRLGASKRTGLVGSTAIVGARIWESPVQVPDHHGADGIRGLPADVAGRRLAGAADRLGEELRRRGAGVGCAADS